MENIVLMLSDYSLEWPNGYKNIMKVGVDIFYYGYMYYLESGEC